MGRGAWSGGGCLVLGSAWSWGVPGRGGAWSGGCLVWGVPGPGAAWSGGVPGGDPPTATAAGGTHPTGMFSCIK